MTDEYSESRTAGGNYLGVSEKDPNQATSGKNIFLPARLAGSGGLAGRL
jgi:hypothetical protein